MELFFVACLILVAVWLVKASQRKQHSKTSPQALPAKVSASKGPSPLPVSKTQMAPELTVQPARRVESPVALKSSNRPFEFCAFDTETTGIVPRSRRHRAFELSCVRFTPMGEKKWSKKRFTRYIKVDVREMKGLKLSPMWEDHVDASGQLNAVEATKALEELRDFLLDLPLVCHNAAFDKCVIENEIEKTSYQWRPRNKWICTLQMARSHRIGTFVGYSPGRDDGMSYKLEDVAKSLHLPFNSKQLHSGSYDAEVAGTVFLKMHHMRAVPIKFHV